MASNKTAMISKIDSFFTSLSGQTWKPSNKGQKTAVMDKLYEIYIYTLVATEIQLTYKVLPKMVTSRFIFRGSPTDLNNSIYSYLEFTGYNGTYELHLSLEIEGDSFVKHEIDVCIIENGRYYAANKILVPYYSVPLTIECKYKEKHEIKKGLGREILGITLDTGRHGRISPLEGRVTYYKSMDPQVEALLEHYSVIPYYIAPNGSDDKFILKFDISHFIAKL